MACDMCGKEVENSKLFYAKVEGTMLRICDGCTKFGKIVKRVEEERVQVKQQARFIPKSEEEIEDMIVEDYAQLIKLAREKKGIKQEDFAKQINEKESLIHKIETGHMEPNIKLANKIEQFLGIHLVEEVQLQNHRDHTKKENLNNFTIGDIIKTRKKVD